MSSLEMIENWHKKASDDDYVSKFIFEYLAFITYLMNHMPLDKEVKDNDKVKKTDRTVIQNLKRNERIENEYLHMVTHGVNFQAVPVEEEWFESDTRWVEMKPLTDELRCSWHTIATILNEAHNQQKEIFNRQDWWNCSNASSKKCEDVSKAIISNEKDWVNMVEFWYKLRSNLLHGIINPEDHEYGLLIKNGYITLRPLVEYLLYYLKGDE